MILIPTLGPVIAGTTEGADEFDTEITPPDYAFAIWAPIFLVSAANAVQHAVDPAAPINRRTGWWLAAAYGANASWSIAAQSGRFRYTPYILGAAATLAGIGYRRAQRPHTRAAGFLAPHSAGLLLGWTSVAAVVNAFATARHGQLATTTRTGKLAARSAVAGAAVALSAVIATSNRGHASVALASTWALVTSATNSERTTGTRLISASAAAVLTGVTVGKLWLDRRERARRP